MAVRAVQGRTGRVRTGRVGAQSGGGGVAPVFQTDFLSLSSLPSGVSLSRATSGTRFNSSGVLVTEAINAPRFDYSWNGSIWVPRGLLAEEQRTNFLLSSGAVGDANWNNGGGASIALNNAASPDGTSSASRITLFGIGGLLYEQTPGLTASSPCTVSGFLKAGTATKIALGIDPGGYVGVEFDLSADTISFSDTGRTGTIQNVANGWFLGTVEMTSGATTMVSSLFSHSATSGNFFSYGEQLEQASFATSYIPTTTAAVTRSADLLSSTAPLTAFLAAGPSVWEFEDESTGVIARTAYAAGAFNWPVSKWYRSMGVYPAGTDTSGHMVVGSGY